MTKKLEELSREELTAYIERMLACLGKKQTGERDWASQFESQAKFYAVLRFTKLKYRVNKKWHEDPRNTIFEFQCPTFSDLDCGEPASWHDVWVPHEEYLERAEKSGGGHVYS